MESTTLEDAVDSLLAPSEETSEDNNFDAAVDAMIEPDDDQSEEVEVADEEQDDVEASSEDQGDDLDDVEIDEEDQVEATEDTVLYTVKVDGKEEQRTLDQLKQGYAGQSAIGRGLQENAQVRKQLEQEKALFQQQQQQFLQLHQQAQNGGLQAPTPPTRELFESDPIGYMEEKLKYDEAHAQYAQNMQQLNQVQQQRTQAQEQARHAYLQEQAQILQQHIPEFADPDKGDKLKNSLVQTGVQYGFTEQEMSAVTDSRYVRALNDARKYRELVAKRKTVQAKGEKARPVVKAGAKKRNDGNAATRNKAKTRLQKTGSIDDALSLILNQ
jgi:hypothetical protein